MTGAAGIEGVTRRAAGDVPRELPADLLAAIQHTRSDELLRHALHYQAMVAADPGNGEALHALGFVAHRAGALEWAARLMEWAVTAVPDRIEFSGNLGNVYHDMGRFDQAIACFRKVVAAAPHSEMAHNNLGNTLQERGDLEEAAASYERAVAAKPDFVAGWSNLGVTLRKLDRPERAIAAFEQALSRQPDFVEALLNLGTLHHEQGDNARAVECLERALALRPDAIAAYTRLQQIRLEEGSYEDALELARRVRRHQPASQMAIATEAIVCLARDDLEAYDHLYGRDDLRSAEMVDPPAGYADSAAFNDALVEEILGHPSLKWIHDSYDTSKRGFVFGVLDHPTPALAAVGELITRGVDDFVAGLEPDPEHPLLGNIPARRRLELWATILTGGGHHPSHIHESKWLSGTYYVRMPASCRADDPTRAGWIEFDGFSHLPGLDRHAALINRVTPRDGLLALFPAYMMHQTAAFTSDDMRIGLSFDIVPA